MATHTTAPEPNWVRIRIEPFVDSTDAVIIEVRAYEEGPRGGAGEPVGFPPEYWKGLIGKLPEAMED